MAEPTPPVAIIMGSQSDWATMARAVEVLDELGIAEDTLTVQFPAGFKTIKAAYVQPASDAARDITPDDVPF